LQAGEHHHGRWRLGECQLPGLAPEDADEFFVDDLDDLLRRVERATGSETSASSSANRISRVVASISASVSRPFPRSPCRAPVNRSDSDSNTLSA
jgi:hypothetical protein